MDLTENGSLSICFYARSGQNILYCKIGKRLEKEGYSTTYIVQNDHEEKIARQQCVRGAIYNLTKYIKENWENYELLRSIDIRSCEVKFNIPSMWKIFFCDRYLTKYNYKDAVKFIKLHISFIVFIMEKEKLRFFVNEDIATFSAYLFYYIFKSRVLKYIGFSVPRIMDDKKVAFTNDDHISYRLLEEFYKNGEFSQAELLEARKIVEEYRIKEIRPAYAIKNGKKPRFQVRFISDLVKFILSFFVKRVPKQNYEKYKENTANYIYDLRNYFRYNLHKKYFKSSNPDEKYYLFPLHFQPEASTLVTAAFYEKQLFTIDIIAKSIPGDTVLYVKEHYVALGHRETDFYKGLKKYPNVRLINPWESSHKLIKGAEGVIILTSTVGWEAIMHGIPVYLLGDITYESFRYINKVENPKELVEIIRKKRLEIINKEEYDQELFRYIASYIKSLKDGYYNLADPAVLSDENVNLLTNALKSECK
jgi:hypothetical protein